MKQIASLEGMNNSVNNLISNAHNPIWGGHFHLSLYQQLISPTIVHLDGPCLTEIHCFSHRDMFLYILTNFSQFYRDKIKFFTKLASKAKHWLNNFPGNELVQYMQYMSHSPHKCIVFPIDKCFLTFWQFSPNFTDTKWISPERWHKKQKSG